jgi:hypothetical protein
MEEAGQPISLSAPRIPKGRGIVRQVLADHGLDADEFFGRGRFAPLVAARRDAARRLRDSGFSWVQTARILKRNEDTIRCYLTEAMQTARRDRMRERRAFTFMPADVVEIIIAFAKAENVKPEVLIAQWASERALYEAQAKVRAA